MTGGRRVGILGGGQLGRMLALAGHPLGLKLRLMDPIAGSCAGDVAPLTVGDYGDAAALDRFAEGLDVVTYEFENVPIEAARKLAVKIPVYPPPRALEVSQDRLFEKTFFNDLGIPTAPFQAIESRADLDGALARIGYPSVLKTRRNGYDGKGQFVLNSAADADAAWAEIGGRPLILEGFVRFTRELSILAVRSSVGETAFYPLVENRHSQGILRTSEAPAAWIEASQPEAERFAAAALGALGYVGVLAIEFFEVDGRLLANEMAPRVHNSGHWTIEGAETSQFENHLRAILGWPLGSTAPRGFSLMLNCIGGLPSPEEMVKHPQPHLHVYGKAPKPGRKVGHVTYRCDRREELVKVLAMSMGGA